MRKITHALLQIKTFHSSTLHLSRVSLLSEQIRLTNHGFAVQRESSPTIGKTGLFCVSQLVSTQSWALLHPPIYLVSAVYRRQFRDEKPIDAPRHIRST